METEWKRWSGWVSGRVVTQRISPLHRGGREMDSRHWVVTWLPDHLLGLIESEKNVSWQCVWRWWMWLRRWSMLFAPLLRLINFSNELIDGDKLCSKLSLKFNFPRHGRKSSVHRGKWKMYFPPSVLMCSVAIPLPCVGGHTLSVLTTDQLLRKIDSRLYLCPSSVFNCKMLLYKQCNLCWKEQFVDGL